jgi:hypothetical protein
MSWRVVSILGAGALWLALGGCTNDTVKKVKAMADRACGCHDAECAKKVEEDFWAFVKTGQKQGSQGDRDEVQAEYNRLRECVTRVRSSSSGTDAPENAPAPAAGAADGKEPAR